MNRRWKKLCAGGTKAAGSRFYFGAFRAGLRFLDGLNAAQNRYYYAAMSSEPLNYFDPAEPIGILTGNLPHWRQEGTVYFVTFRLADSIAQEKLQQWKREQEAWLQNNPPPHSPLKRREYYDLFPARFQYWLDQGYGSCVLRNKACKEIVETALSHFEGARYNLDEFIVMPNHVHAIVIPNGDYTLSEVLHSWKSYTANLINRHMKRDGKLWQKESFDHIVRNAESMERIRQYIRANPK